MRRKVGRSFAEIERFACSARRVSFHAAGPNGKKKGNRPAGPGKIIPDSEKERNDGGFLPRGLRASQ